MRLFIALLTTILVAGNGQAQNSEKQLAPGIYANMKTTEGDILIWLDYEKVPMTAANFIGLCEGKIELDSFKVTKPYYDGVVFHRVLPNFVIQAGQAAGTNAPGPGYKFPDEFDSTLMHTGAGILSMANAGPGTNGSQFFVTKAATPHLNFKHSVFGHVIHGQAVVDSIKQTDDSIITIEIIRVGEKALKFEAAKVFKTMVLEKRQAAIDAVKKRNEVFKKEMSEKYPNATQLASGLMYEVITKGNGAYPKTGQKVEVHYLGTLLDGTKFDASYDRNTPFSVNIGYGKVIKGWDEGIPLCDVGGKIRLIIPYWLAYGEAGQRTIPAKATLIFEVEMLSFQ